jgi:hypothetical protein
VELLVGLPQHVRENAVLPTSASCALEPSLCASRLRGFDATGALCLYQHEFKLAEIDFDADDSPYVRVSLHEMLTAVRSHDGTWLCRCVRCEPESAAGDTYTDTGFRSTCSADLPAELTAQRR